MKTQNCFFPDPTHTATVANSAKNCLARFQKQVPHAAMGRPSPIQIQY